MTVQRKQVAWIRKVRRDLHGCTVRWAEVYASINPLRLEQEAKHDCGADETMTWLILPLGTLPIKPKARRP